MRALLALILIAALGAAIGLSSSTSHRPATVHLARLSASTSCSSSSGCVLGCTLPVSSEPATPRGQGGPCAEQHPQGCSEYVLGRLTKPGQPSSPCAKSSPAYAERLTAPNVETLRRRDHQRRPKRQRRAKR